MPVLKSQYLSEVWKDGLFDGKVVFCTGGSGTMCSFQVRAMVHLGANACIVGRSAEKTAEMARDIETARPGSRVLGLAADVRSISSMMTAVNKCVSELGSLDFAIIGAAGNFLAPIEQMSANAFQNVLNIDLAGSFNTLKAALPHLLKSASSRIRGDRIGTSGRVVFISATVQYTGLPMQAHAGAAKAGVDALSATVAIEMGPRGMTSNVIAPGPIRGTEGMRKLSLHTEDAGMEKTIPVGRFGTVRDIADAVVYLFSDAGSYVNGEVLVVDGGSWRTGKSGPGADFAYPDFLLSGRQTPRGDEKRPASTL